MSATVRSPPDAPPRATAPELWILAGIVVAAAALRFATLDASSYWQDEAYTVFAVRGGLSDAWHAVVTTESTPPLYYMLAWAWANVFGTGEVGLRSLSAIFGIATVPAIWLVGRELVSRRASLLAAALVASSPLLLWYAQEARAYALGVLLVVVAFWLVLRARRGVPHAALWWALAAALALAAHYVAIFPIVAQALLLLWWRRERASAVAVGLVGLAGVALVPLLVTQRGNDLANQSRGRPVRQLAETAKQFAVGYDLPWELALSILALALMAAGLLLVALAGERTRRGAAIAGVVALSSPVGLLLLYLAGQNQLMSRYMLPALPLVLLAVAAGYGTRRAGRWGLAGAALLCAIGLGVSIAVALTPAHQTREDYQGAAEVLDRSSLRPRVVVVFPPAGGRPLSLFLPGSFSPVAPDVTVREVDFVDVERGVDHRRPVPFPPVLPSNVAFRKVSEHRTEAGAVVRYVAPAPSSFPLVSVITLQAAGRQSSVLYQR